MDGIISTGLCSYGMSGKLFHAPFIAAHPGFSLDGVVERTKDEARLKFPGVRRYHAVQDMLQDEGLQLIIVNTPTYTHFEYAKAAINARKNIVVEKPMVTTTSEAQELVDLAKKNEVFISVYQNKRYDGDFLAVKAIVEKGYLGELREVEMKYDRYRPGLSGKMHKEGNMPGSGILYDLGSHLIDQALQLFGLPHALFANVWTMRDNTEADDYFELLFYYDRLIVRLKASCLVREMGYAYILHGTKGSFLQKRSDQQEKRLLDGAIPAREPWCPAPETPDGLLHTEIDGQVTRQELFSLPGNYMDYFEDVQRALTGQASNPVPPEDGVRVMRLLETARQSAVEGRVIKV